jgi:PleD family two-component response regulator
MYHGSRLTGSQRQKPGKFKNAQTKKNILVAEDEQSNFLLIREVLSDKKFNLLHAVDGLEALDDE